MPKYFVAIDGGGTKTDVVLFDDTGVVISRAIGKSTNPSALTDEQVRKNFSNVFADVFNLVTPLHITSCFAGMAGADHPKLNSLIKNLIENALPVPCEKIEIQNDTTNALWSGTDGKPGVVVIAGTGSIAYARRKDGSSFRIGGWGHLVGDDGSGYYIGKEAVRAALRSHDGMAPYAPLFDKIKKHYHIPTMPDVIPIVYGAHKTILSELAPLVVASAEVGDEVAITILKNSANFLTDLIKTALSHFDDDHVPVVLVGGLWRSELLRQEVTSRFKQNFIMPEFPPVYGSMVGALGTDHPKELLNTIKRFFKD